MNPPLFHSRHPLAGAMILVLACMVATPTLAQQQTQNPQEAREAAARGNQAADEAPPAYPEATRQAPKPHLSSRTSKQLEKMMKLYDGEKGTDARALADEILANEAADAYAKSYAAQIAAQVAYAGGDIAAAINYYDQALATDGLDNNSHYNVMLNLAQMQQAGGHPEKSLATYERFFEETRSQEPQHLMMKGQALYLLKRYPEAAAAMKQAIDASSEPKPEWQALLMQAYAESGQGSEALQMAEKVAAAKPDDKQAQMNLAIIYQQTGMTDKATAVLEKLRASGQLTEAAEYQQLYATYINLEGHEKQAVDVIQEGLQKGILKPDLNTYVALAQSYYFSDQPGLAIEAYQKAAPLDDDGETYLNLAKVLINEGRTAEAQAAAKQALAKGVEKPEQAKSIIAN